MIVTTLLKKELSVLGDIRKAQTRSLVKRDIKVKEGVINDKNDFYRRRIIRTKNEQGEPFVETRFVRQRKTHMV
jgi:hypothetical protein